MYSYTEYENMLKQFPKTEFKPEKDDCTKDDVDVLYLVKDTDTNKYSITFEPSNNKILESFVVSRRCVSTNEHLDILNKILSNFAENDEHKHYGFFTICQRCCVPYWFYPFGDNDSEARVNLRKYLANDDDWILTINDDVHKELPPIESLKNFHKLLHWKHARYTCVIGNFIVPMRAESDYETFALKWIEHRIIFENSNYIPDEVLHSLDNSNLCSMSHTFIDAIYSARAYNPLRIEAVCELFKSYIPNHLEDLKKNDINNRTAVQYFNAWYPIHDFRGEEIKWEDKTIEIYGGKKLPYGKWIESIKILFNQITSSESS